MIAITGLRRGSNINMCHLNNNDKYTFIPSKDTEFLMHYVIFLKKRILIHRDYCFRKKSLYCYDNIIDKTIYI